jgi:hypothetical protein
MSLRTRLVLLITGLAAAVAIVLSCIGLNGYISTWLDHTEQRTKSTTQFVKSYVLDRAQERAADLPPAANLAGRIAQWREVIATDRDLSPLLGTIMAQTSEIVEISVADSKGAILASSNVSKIGSAISTKLPLKNLLDLGPLDRLLAIYWGSMDFESRVELGVTGKPVFLIQVLVSTVLIKEAMKPQIKSTAVASLVPLMLAVLIAFGVAQIALWPLARISSTIDRIASGEVQDPETQSLGSGRELAAVQQKLRLLGEQFRGAREDASQMRGSVERMLDRLEEAIFLFDSRGLLQVCSEVAERLLRASKADLVGKHVSDLFHAGLPLGGAVSTAMARGEPMRDKVVGRLVVNLEPLPGGAFLLRLRDAEGRRIVETQLTLSTRLAAISRLTGGVAHEIKNPLNSIALRLELLKSRVLGDVPEAEAEIEVIAQEITRLNRVVRTFLDFTRPVELHPRQVDLAALIAGLAELFGPEAEGAGISVWAAGLENPMPASVDTDLMKQALTNIVRNALEAMPHGGKLSLALRQEGGMAAIEIADTGPGVPAEAKEKIFELYYSTKQKGSGIGLAMAYRAVQLHGGSIEVLDGPEGGALFRVWVPVSTGGVGNEA